MPGRGVRKEIQTSALAIFHVENILEYSCNSQFPPFSEARWQVKHCLDGSDTLWYQLLVQHSVVVCSGSQYKIAITKSPGMF